MGDLGMFPTRLKEIRQNLNMTQKDFGEYVGLTQATLSAYEKGGKNPSLENVKTIAEKCEISIDWLCGLDTSKYALKKKLTMKEFAILLIRILDYSEEAYACRIIDPEYNGPLDFSCVPDNKWALILDDDDDLEKFLEGYTKMVLLLKDNTIDRVLFDSWLDGALSKLENIDWFTKTFCN